MADLFSETCAMTLPAIKVDSLVYSFVKDKNPCLLTQMFSKEKCRELEKLDVSFLKVAMWHLYDETSLLSMLQAYRETRPKSNYPNDHVEKKSAEKKGRAKPVDQSDRKKDEAAQKPMKAKPQLDDLPRVKPIAVKENLYSEDMMHRRFCRIDDPQTSVDLTVYNYFHLNGDLKALEMLFIEEDRSKFGKMVTKVDVPSVLRLVAHRRKETESTKSENKKFSPISTCQLCKKNIKGPRSHLMGHIGRHEDIPMYCFVEGCDKYTNSYSSIGTHLLGKHLLYRNDLTASQYHQLYSMKLAYNKKAGRFMDKYFPPESFVSFSDRKIQRRNEFEDVKCVSCGEVVKVASTRLRHVLLHHLNLSYACVVEGCQAATNPIDFAMHLAQHHSKNVRQLNAQELHQHRLNREHFNKVMKSELSKFFPRKSGAVGEVEEIQSSDPTFTNLSLDSLLYGYVKAKNPCLLTQLFSKEKCRELEKLDHLYDSKTLPTMLQKYRKIHGKPVEQKNRRKHQTVQKREKPRSDVHHNVKSVAVTRNLYDKDKMHRRFCRITDLQTSVDLVVFNHFELKGDRSALEMMFDEETREKFGKMVKEIDVPTVFRMAAHRRNEKEKSKAENKSFLPISKCELCKMNIKGTGSLLRGHIGRHEDIPMYCFIEGCDKYVRSYHSIGQHLLDKHLLYRNDLNASQYHQLYSMKLAYNKKAGLFMDKYFPPESFVGFSDRKTLRRNEFEDVKCASCGEIVKSPRSRLHHVAFHLNLSYVCVIQGCSVATDPTNFGTHLKHHHAKRVRQLNVQELQKHRQNKAHFNKVMKEELPKYFPRKSAGDEE